MDNGDFSIDKQGRLVFTEQFLRKRGFCCHNGCRHCPYKEQEKESNEEAVEA